MQNFRPEAVHLDGNVASFGAMGTTYRVILTVERMDGKKITEAEARRIYTEAMTAFPQSISVGRLTD